ncbi:transport permease protein [Actinoplanes sp. OR16]|uniref:ABC transporter permease n=1 Tax=Actinoplanes sp. OR16 TaxID=946334 RepID=UPI000F6C800F|nr:ABC transporter permease [Actinoplanes sp. OR16]BBH70327.1 transport permease protein [Actinoplanes sp. OR16]
MRIRSIGAAELRLFGRNRTALFSALAMPVILTAAIATSGLAEVDSTSSTALVVTSLLGFVLLAAVYYNLVTTYVARREERVLKRLRAGELGDAAILTGIAAPMVAVALGQMVAFVVGGAVLLGLPVPVNLPLLLAGALGGIVVFVLLAALSAVFTRTAESAQVTTLPVLLGCLLASMLYPVLDDAPAAVTAVLKAMPLSPVVDLMRLGWLGTTGEAAPLGFTALFAEALLPLAITAGWIVAGLAGVRRAFRWEPRR